MSRKLLLIDDDPDALNVLKTILDCEGYTVHIAINLDEAIAAVKKHEVDLAIIDFIIPGCRGDLMAKVLKTVNQNLQIIFLSGHEGVYEAVEKLNFPVYNIFMKPEKISELLLTIKSVFEENNFNKHIVHYESIVSYN